MSRYKAPLKRMVFEDRPGLEVVMRSISIGKLMDLAGAYDAAQAGTATAAQVRQMCDALAARLVSWNLDDENDEPVPATPAGVQSLDADLFLDIARGWFEDMTMAPKASPPASPNGTHPEAGLPMVPISS